MISIRFFHKIYILLLLFFVSMQTGFSQSSPSEEISNEIFEKNIIVDNSEINFEICDANLYKTVDSTHMFYGSEEFVNGSIHYKNQTYKTKLKYDLLNDLVIVNYYDDQKDFSLSLDCELIDQFMIDGHKIIKLSKSKGLKTYYENGYFEKVYDGTSFSFFIKHRKKLKKNKDRTNVFYSFLEETIYLFEYKKSYYQINNKRDIIKAIPHFKNDVNDFFGRYNRKVDQTSLTRLLMQLDKVSS